MVKVVNFANIEKLSLIQTLCYSAQPMNHSQFLIGRFSVVLKVLIVSILLKADAPKSGHRPFAVVGSQLVA